MIKTTFDEPSCRLQYYPTRTASSGTPFVFCKFFCLDITVQLCMCYCSSTQFYFLFMISDTIIITAQCTTFIYFTARTVSSQSEKFGKMFQSTMLHLLLCLSVCNAHCIQSFGFNGSWKKGRKLVPIPSITIQTRM